MLPGPIPSYIGTGADGNPVQIHLIPRQSPSFPQLAELVVKAQASPPIDPFQVLDLPDELAVVTGGLPPGVGFEDWIREATSGAQPPRGPSTLQAPPTPQEPPVPSEPSAPPPTEESYTQYFQLPQDPPTPQPSVASPPVTSPGIPDPTPEPSDYSEFFQAPVAGEQAGHKPATSAEPVPPPPPPTPAPPSPPPQKTEPGGYTDFFQAAGPSGSPAQPDSPPEPSTPVQSQAPPPPPPTQAGPPPSIPTQLAVPTHPPVPSHRPPDQAPLAPAPAVEPDPDSITAEFRRPMPPPPNKPSGRGRNWTPSQRGAKPQVLAMGEYLSRLDSSSGPSVSGTPRPPAPPAAPSWARDDGSHGGGGSSAPTVVTRSPTPQGKGGPQARRFRTRDLVIFGAIIGVVVIAAIATVVIVILSTD